MNSDRIRRLADVVGSLEHLDTTSPDVSIGRSENAVRDGEGWKRFTMWNWWSEFTVKGKCGTAGCVAGWACHVFDPE